MIRLSGFRYLYHDMRVITLRALICRRIDNSFIGTLFCVGMNCVNRVIVVLITHSVSRPIDLTHSIVQTTVPATVHVHILLSIAQVRLQL